jgi:hypothetical protein
VIVVVLDGEANGTHGNVKKVNGLRELEKPNIVLDRLRIVLGVNYNLLDVVFVGLVYGGAGGKVVLFIETNRDVLRF